MVNNMKNKTVLIIFTGGTISMQKHAGTNKAIISNNQNALIKSIANELSGIRLLTHEFSMKPSPSIDSSDMFSLAKLTFSYMENPDIDGIVVTHGTDTLEETAYFLDLFLETKKPVVFTGSMRNYSEVGFDGLSNLVSAILVSAHDASKERGVLLVMNDEINAAREVTKSHTLSLDTFKSLEFGPLGIVDQERVLYYRKTQNVDLKITPGKLTKRIEIVKVYSGSDSLLLNLLVDQHVDGIVLEALGRGNVPPQMVPGIIRAIENQIPVVITSRCPMGRVLDSYGYEGGGHHLKRLGVLFADDLNSQKTRIKLLLSLSLSSDLEKLKQYFDYD